MEIQSRACDYPINYKCILLNTDVCRKLTLPSGGDNSKVLIYLKSHCLK